MSAEPKRAMTDNQTPDAEALAANELGEALFFDRLETARTDVAHLKAQRDDLIRERDEARTEATRQGSEVARLTRVLEGVRALADGWDGDEDFFDRSPAAAASAGAEAIRAVLDDEEHW